MKELGEESDAFHAALAEPICASNVNFAILVGPEMAPLAEQLEGKVGFAHVPDADAAAKRLQSELRAGDARSEEHTSELQSLMRISYAVFCLKKNIQGEDIQYG